MIRPALAFKPLSATEAKPMVAQRHFAQSVKEFEKRFGLTPLALFGMQDAASPIVDLAGGVNLTTEVGPPTYRSTGDAGRFAVEYSGTAANRAAASSSFDLATSGKLSIFIHTFIPSHDVIVGSTFFAGKFSAAGYTLHYDETIPGLVFWVEDGTNTIAATVSADHSDRWVSALACIDMDNDLVSLHSELGADVDVDSSVLGSITNGGAFSLGAVGGTIAAGSKVGYCAVFDSYCGAADFAALIAKSV